MKQLLAVMAGIALVLGLAPAAQAGPPPGGWQETSPTSPWEARAGLQAVTLDGQILLMGCRTPTVAFYEGQPVVGASIVYNDVWSSGDQGHTWTEIAAAAPWAERAYFKAVKHRGAVYVLGGQNFKFGDACLPPGGIPGGPPPGIPGIPGAGDPGGPPVGIPIVPTCSDFFNDVWKSEDGETWIPVTLDAPWEGRAGLSAWSHRGSLFVAGGSVNDDSAIIGPGGPPRIYFDDVWRSDDGGVTWIEAAAHAGWEPRAGAATATKGRYTYLIGGEDGFTCDSGDRCPPYYNDVWRTTDGTAWELVTEDAGFSPRPGHQCLPQGSQIVCFGGFGLPDSSLQPPDPGQPFDPTACIGEPPANPTDMWSTRDGATWTELPYNAWGSDDPADMRYDFAAVTAPGRGGAILTFGGDQETFCFADPENVNRVTNDVWRFRAAGR